MRKKDDLLYNSMRVGIEYLALQEYASGIRKDNKTQRETISNLNLDINNSLDSIKKLEASLYQKDKDLENQIKITEQITLDLKNAQENSYQQKQSFDREIEKLKNSIEKKDFEIEDLKQKNVDLFTERKSLKEEIKEKSTRISNFNFILKDKENKTSELEASLYQKGKDLKNAQENSYQQKQSFDREIEKLKNSIEKKDSEILYLKQQISKLKLCQKSHNTNSTQSIKSNKTIDFSNTFCSKARITPILYVKQIDTYLLQSQPQHIVTTIQPLEFCKLFVWNANNCFIGEIFIPLSKMQNLVSYLPIIKTSNLNY